MPTFSYQGSQAGNSRSGEIEATDQRAALTALRKTGIVPVLVTEVSANAANSPGNPKGKKQSAGVSLSFLESINSKDITALTRQLATLTNAGFPLVKGLGFVQRQGEKQPLRDLVESVNNEVRSGAALSEALAQHPKHFDSLYTNMIKAGEAGGILALLLDRLADMREADEALVSKIKGAMTYPVVMLLAMIASLVIMFIFVVPKFATMFEDMGQALPTPTVVMMAISAVFQQYWWAVAASVAAVVGLYMYWGSTTSGRRSIDRMKLNLPVLGKFATKVAMTRFCRTFGTLLDSGVNLIAALEASRGVAGNTIISQAVADSLKPIREGKKVGQTLEATGYFPPLVCEMISLGEESGRMGTMSLKVADIYERETDDLVKALTSIVEPVMILFMGGVVGIVVVAMLMPIFSMNLGA